MNDKRAKRKRTITYIYATISGISFMLGIASLWYSSSSYTPETRNYAAGLMHFAAFLAGIGFIGAALILIGGMALSFVVTRGND